MAQPQSLPMVDRLERASADLDDIIRDLRLGRPSQARHDVIVDRVRRVAATIDGTTRKTPAPVAPPRFLERRADGSAKACW